MSSIFNLLGEIAESDRGQIMKSIVQSETSHNIKLNSLKTMGGTKPKKLKMRSNSDMNLSHSTHSINVKKNTNGNKELDCLKLKKLIAQSPKFKEFALKEMTVIDKSPKAQLNEDIFKKPLSYKKNIKQFPKPEKLAYWYDDQYKFDYGYIEAIEKEFKDLFSKEKENIKPSEEKELMLETPMLLEVPKLVFDGSFDEEHKKFLSCDLPEISDISDDDTLQ